MPPETARGGDGPNPLGPAGVKPPVSTKNGGDGPMPLGIGEGGFPFLQMTFHMAGGDGPFPLNLGSEVTVRLLPHDSSPSYGFGLIRNFINNTHSDAYLALYGSGAHLITKYARGDGSLWEPRGSGYLPDGEYVYSARTVMGDVVAWGKLKLGPANETVQINAGADAWTIPLEKKKTKAGQKD